MIHLAIGSGDEGEGSRMLDVCAARLCSLCRLILSAGRQLHRSLLLCFLSLLRAVFYSLSLSLHSCLYLSLQSDSCIFPSTVLRF